MAFALTFFVIFFASRQKSKKRNRIKNNSHSNCDIATQIKNELLLQIFLFFALSMQLNSAIKRGIAILLLLVFFQQMGAGLFVHNLLHDKAIPEQSPIKKNESTKEISFSCSCVDNFLMPFAAADQPVISNIVIAHPKAVDSYTEQPYHVSLIFSSLRGPPVFIG